MQTINEFHHDGTGEGFRMAYSMARANLRYLEQASPRPRDYAVLGYKDRVVLIEEINPEPRKNELVALIMGGRLNY